MVVAAALARALRQGARPRLTWRFVFAPTTIGALAWLARHESRLSRLRAGLVIGLLGDGGALTYKRSRRGDTLVDRAARLVVAEAGGRVVPFDPYGYDERQFCSPGFDLPVGRLTRTPHGGFPEYHTSADNLDFVQPIQLQHSLQALARIIGVLDANRRWRNLKPQGEPRLGQHGLFGATGRLGVTGFEHALLWVLNQSDGRHDLVDIALRSGMPFATLSAAAKALHDAGLLTEAGADDGGTTDPPTPSCPSP
jgi:aminopeptidase-like protein